jgi:hypothetical protein
LQALSPTDRSRLVALLLAGPGAEQGEGKA